MSSATPVHPPARFLLGPGPSNVDPSVLQAASSPILGHLDPAYFPILAEVGARLRRVFGTENQLTLAVPGTGFSGMEAALCNLLEAGDTILVGSAGYFGGKLIEIAHRCGAQVQVIEGRWGQPLDPAAFQQALKQYAPVKVVALVLAETSTGVLQPLEEIARLTHDHDALLLVDAVTALGGLPVNVDALGIDACYSCTQKCLGALPGLAPITFSERAVSAIKRRKTPVQSWYLDALALADYWYGSPHSYHHTSNVSLVYALHQALGLGEQEGWEARYTRHQRHGQALQAGLEAMGLELFAAPGHRLPMLTTVRIPAGVDDTSVRQALLETYNIEIGGGLGEYKGRIWRLGLMGYNASERSVLHLLASLERLLERAGVTLEAGAGRRAADAFYAKQQH